MTHEQGWHLDAVAMGSRIDVLGRAKTANDWTTAATR
jgi:hypothetical protein